MHERANGRFCTIISCHIAVDMVASNDLHVLEVHYFTNSNLSVTALISELFLRPSFGLG
jgi:hypothetical protein